MTVKELQEKISLLLKGGEITEDTLVSIGSYDSNNFDIWEVHFPAAKVRAVKKSKYNEVDRLEIAR